MKESMQDYENQEQLNNSGVMAEIRQALLENKRLIIKRSSGEEDGGWQVGRILDGGRILVTKGESVKYITEKDFVNIDERRFVTVPRTGDYLDDNWYIKEFVRNKQNTGMDVVVKSENGELQKTIPYEILQQYNPQL